MRLGNAALAQLYDEICENKVFVCLSKKIIIMCYKGQYLERYQTKGGLKLRHKSD